MIPVNERQRFYATMHYQPRDRAPICDFSFWDETLPTWHAQGLPEWVNRETSDAYFGMDRLWGAETETGVAIDLAPAFEYRVLEDRGDHEVVQQVDGVRVLRKKFMGSIPQHLGHLLVDRASWDSITNHAWTRPIRPAIRPTGRRASGHGRTPRATTS